MQIQYDKSKGAQCYGNFVENPSDRNAIREFKKMFGQELMTPALKLHARLVSIPNVGAYNTLYKTPETCIGFKQGGGDGDPLVLKVRINLAYRKFFQAEIGGSILARKDWDGNLHSLNSLRVIDVNKHDYR